MQDMNRGSKLLATFKIKIEEAVALVPNMVAEEKLKAVQFWNVVSEKLQEIVNNSAADISALAFELEKENASKGPDETDMSLSDDTNKAHRDSQHLVTADHNEGTALAQPLPSAQPHQLSAFGNVPVAGPISAIQLTSHELVVLRPHSAVEHVPQSLILTSPSRTLLLANSLPDSIVGGRSVTTQVNLRPPEESECTVQMETEPRTFQPEEVVRNAQQEPLCEMVSEIPAVGKNLQAKKVFARRKAGKEETSETSDADWKVNNSRTKMTRKKKATAGDASNPRRQPPRNSRWKNFPLSAEKECISLDADGSEDSWNVGNNDVVTDQSDSDEVINQNDNTNTDLKGKNGDKNFSKAKSGKVGRKKKGVSQSNDSSLSEVTEIANLVDVTMAQNSCQAKPYFCNECDARFSSRGNLIVHCRRHTGEKPYTCPQPQCSARFSTRGNLKRHIKTHSGEKPWHCAQCGGCFTEKKSLKVHMRKHTGEKPYQCNVCGKSFAQTGILQTHMAMHMDQKEHLCEHCGKSFRQKSQLRLHMMRHEGFRKYECLTCPAKFLTKGDLERHNRVHTGERPFVCELCGRTFTRQQSLNEHMNRHYGITPYQCKYCGKCFAEMSACYKHIKQHEKTCNFEGREEPDCHSDTSERVLTEAADLEVGATVVEAIESPGPEHKFAALVHVGVGDEVDVAETEVVVDSRESDASRESRSRTADFTAINLLACASSFQQTF